MGDDKLEELIRRMEDLTNYSDFEIAHFKADEILCEALEYLGQDRLVELFRKVGKWYA